MAILIFTFACAAIPPALALLFLPRGSQFATVMAISMIGLTFLLHALNEEMPFSSGGDDVGYYLSSKVEFASFADWFDLKQFSNTHIQTGYSLVNAWIHQIAGPSLFARKMFNLLLFGTIAVWWAYIGNIVGGRKVSNVFGMSILVATPLWFYFVFLLKDMLITFLESLLIGSVTIYLCNRKLLVPSFAVLATSFLLMPLRLPFVVFNFAALAATILVHYASSLGFGQRGRLLVFVLAGFALLAFNAGTRSEITDTLGISPDHRVDLVRYQERIDNLAATRRFSKVTFPILYLIGETQGLNPKALSNGFDEFMLRGLLWLPWTFLGLPLFFLGVIFVARGYWQRLPVLGRTLDNSQILRCPVFANDYRLSMTPVVTFAVAFAVLSWVAVDTTRYRIASLPPLFILAATGYLWFPQRTRSLIIASWLLLVTLFAVVYYGLRG